MRMMTIAQLNIELLSTFGQTGAQSEQVAHKMDEILKRNGFERYTANEKPRYRDGDINLLTNIRKYRFFDWKKKESKK